MKKEFFKPEVEVIEIGIDILTNDPAVTSLPSYNAIGYANPGANVQPQGGQDLPIIAEQYDSNNPLEEPTDIYEYHP